MKAFIKSERRGKSWDRKLTIIICALLVVVTLSVYQQVATHNFINFDDDLYITQNPRVANGLTWENVGWAFSTTYFGNWHPLTWLSYFLDAQLFGVNAPAFLLVNVFIHIANTLLLFFFFNRATQCTWRSAFLAALFALHPLHVESVAWASERKDVLCAFFWILTMGAYFSHVKAPTRAGYLRMLFCFVLGLMAKPMLVTLPFVLLLMDYWPLNRVNFSALPERIARAFRPLDNQNTSSPTLIQQSPIALIKEKIPLFLIVAASATITVIAQQSQGAVAPLEIIPFGSRVANALISYSSYLIQMLWPYPLSVFYPLPVTIPWGQIVAAGSSLVIVSCLTLKYTSRFPYLLVGWLWYLGTLVPVIGLLQVGAQAMADRYTYIPLIGVFMLLVWLAFDMAASIPLRQVVLCLLGTVVMLVLVTLSTRQVGYWKNSFTVWKHVLETTSGSATAHVNFGIALVKRARFTEATAHFKTAIKLEPQWAHPYNNLGLAISEQGRLEESLLCFEQAHRLDPTEPIAVKNYNRVKRLLDEKLDAITLLEQQTLREPTNVELQIRIGHSYQQIYKFKEATTHYRNALTIDADSIEARRALANAFTMVGNYPEAEAQFKQVIEVQPKSAKAYYLLAGLYGRQNRTKLTLEWLKKAVEMGFCDWKYLKIDPNFNFLRNHPEFDKLIHQPT